LGSGALDRYILTSRIDAGAADEHHQGR
jgi:hypothetical protein